MSLLPKDYLRQIAHIYLHTVRSTLSYRETISPSWCVNINGITLPLSYHPITAPTYIILSKRNDDWSHFVGDARKLPQQFISLLLMVCMLLGKGKYKWLSNYIPVISALYATMDTTIWRIIRIMVGITNRDSCREYFRRLKILPLQSQYL
jgi:hypothetical protein